MNSRHIFAIVAIVVSLSYAIPRYSSLVSHYLRLPSSTHGSYHTTPRWAPSANRGERCGVERWSIKTLTDPQARSLPTTPRWTTISHIVSLSAPSDPNSLYSRQASFETTEWAIHAQLVGYKVENDEDYHLVLKDPQTGETMIGEVPSPNCASAFAGQFRSSRATIDSIGRSTASTRWQWLDHYGSSPPMVTVYGYGFYDQIHGQTGVARNGAEIHPIMAIGPTRP